MHRCHVPWWTLVYHWPMKINNDQVKHMVHHCQHHQPITCSHWPFMQKNASLLQRPPPSWGLDPLDHPISTGIALSEHGCILVGPNSCFFLLHHQALWNAMVYSKFVVTKFAIVHLTQDELLVRTAGAHGIFTQRLAPSNPTAIWIHPSSANWWHNWKPMPHNMDWITWPLPAIFALWAINHCCQLLTSHMQWQCCWKMW